MPLSNVRLTEHAKTSGCAAKFAPGALARVLGDMPNVADPDLLVGFDTSDDGCVYRVGENLGLVQSVDFFPPMVDDPFLFGQIAATNALSDIYAMGGAPSHALNLLCFPGCLGTEAAAEVLKGGAERCVAAGCAIAGGHSIADDVPKYGLSVTGFVPLDRMLTNAAARPGDVLLLTKAIGAGVLSTAIKGELIDQQSVEARVLYASMTTLNEAPIRLSEGLEVHGCTDVTGFSLLGHSCEMAEASGVLVEIEASAVPLFDRVLEMARLGIVPAGTYRNREFFGPRVGLPEGLARGMEDALFDPQTSGGLLMALAPEDADELCRRMGDEGRLCARIGLCRPSEADGPSVRVLA